MGGTRLPCEDQGVGTVIPLSDDSRRPRSFAVATALIILINVVVFVQELLHGNAFVERWAAVPAMIVSGRAWVTILTAMFLHEGWMHIIGNMVFLWAFGPEMEDAMGHLRYVVFYLVGGVVAMVVQIAAIPGSTIPCLGASGAIAAVMGAFLVTYPRDRIRSVLIILVFISIARIPAALLIGVWFLIQLFHAGTVANVQSGGVAYMAHVGGFLFGMLTARMWRRKPTWGEGRV